MTDIALIDDLGNALVDTFGNALTLLVPTESGITFTFDFDPFDGGRNRRFVEHVLGVEFY